ncbi:AMIN-like domain-containing (lipo)protein [Streptomyces sp. XY332]|uniref:AMIN-like domain-containing (lipo)protein n=1 Tax=Streptomyces sp. XY332 TaxID=1415561 RepID=UPI0006B15D1F|nr:hypothetical protein [Streptomyces sp. XY332]KOY59965.1 hypothetical protein ADK59_01680 [Streptomyces sp. XY332]
MNHLHRRQLVALATGALLTAGITLAAPASAVVRPTPLVVNARWGGHCTYDRIVIDLRGHVPGVTVTRVPKLVQDGSGKPVPLAGKHFLQIRLHPAAAHNRAGDSTYHGPKLVKIYLPQLKGLAMTGDFEGYVTFGAAFHSKPSFTSFKLHGPERFVLDVAHRNVCR